LGAAFDLETAHRIGPQQQVKDGRIVQALP
jgi:hypothetical protein